MSITKEKKSAVIKASQKTKHDTGSCEVQISVLTERINKLTGHLQANTKDKHSKFGLIRMVERMKKLLAYLSRTDEKTYKTLIAHLDIRK